MNIKNRIIKLLGGFTKQDYHREITDNNNIDLMPVYSETLNYYIDDDTLESEKEQLAYEIGKEMLDNNLIDFTIKEKKMNLD